MSLTQGQVEERLIHAFHEFAEVVPEHPPAPWSTVLAASRGPRRHVSHLIGVAASVVLIALATIVWAAPSAGARYHGGQAIRMGHVVSVRPPHPNPRSADAI
jgi:hypothetical protein